MIDPRAAFDLWATAWRASLVVPLRLARVAAGGGAASAEVARMVAEKQAAMTEAMIRASMAMAQGAGAAAIGAAAHGPIRRRVRANLRRLSRS